MYTSEGASMTGDTVVRREVKQDAIIACLIILGLYKQGNVKIFFLLGNPPFDRFAWM